MAKDIAPKLAEAIDTTFSSLVSTDTVIRSFNSKLAKGTATQKDVFNYTERLGRHASKALTLCLTPDNLPDSRLYWNIATRTVKPLLQRVHSMINEAAISVQTAEDQRNGIGVKAMATAFPEERINDLLNKLCSLDLSEEGDNEQR